MLRRLLRAGSFEQHRALKAQAAPPHAAAVEQQRWSAGRRGHEATFRCAIMSLNTWARPDAVLELSVKAQVNFQRGLVNLNPRGRPPS